MQLTAVRREGELAVRVFCGTLQRAPSGSLRDLSRSDSVSRMQFWVAKQAKIGTFSCRPMLAEFRRVPTVVVAVPDGVRVTL